MRCTETAVIIFLTILINVVIDVDDGDATNVKLLGLYSFIGQKQCNNGNNNHI